MKQKTHASVKPRDITKKELKKTIKKVRKLELKLDKNGIG